MGNTVSISLTNNAWVQIALPGQRVLIQRLTGVVYVTGADLQPAPTVSDALRLNDGDPLNIRNDLPLWARASGDTARLSVTVLPSENVALPPTVVEDLGLDEILARLVTIANGTPSLTAGSVPVHVTNQVDLSTVVTELVAIKSACQEIDANTDQAEALLTSLIAKVEEKGELTHTDLLGVIAQLQEVDANTTNEEAILTNILNKLISAPATLAEQQTQSTTLLNLLARLPLLLLDKLPVLSHDYLIEIARGLIPGSGKLELRGYNDQVGSGNYEPIWANSGASYPVVTSAVTLTLSSSSANDTSAGTGARTVLVRYVRFSDLVEVPQVVTLNGVTPVTVSNDVYAVNEVRVLTAGGSGNIGILYCGFGTVSGGGVPASVLATVPVGANVSQQLIYTVPANKEANILSYGASVSKLMYVQLRIKPSKSSALVYWEYDIPINGAAPTPSISVPIVLTAGQQVQGWSLSSSTTGAAGITMRGILRSV